jgi:hypothetical protein
VSPSVAQRRLAAQHVARPALASPRDAVAWLGAVQAQDLAAATWALALRTRGQPRLADVQRAIERGEIVRTWPMRRTLHFVPAEDARWMVRTLAARQLRRSASRRRALGLGESHLDAARRALARALRGGGRVTRPEAYAILGRAGVPTSGQRGIHLLADLAQEGTLCIGPNEGKQPTFVLLDEWAKRPRDGSLAALAQRYAASHGPASLADFAWWTGLAQRDAREALASARGIREGREGWQAIRPRAAREASPAAHLLPAFDELAVAYKDRSALLARAGRVTSPQVGLLSPSILLGGQVVGTWGRTMSRGRVEIELKPLVAWSAAEREAVEREAEAYARFLGLDASVKPSPPRGKTT